MCQLAFVPMRMTIAYSTSNESFSVMFIAATKAAARAASGALGLQTRLLANGPFLQSG